MNPESSIERQREVFLKALEKPSPAERAAYLDGACGDDLTLRVQVEALLARHATDSFLEDPAAAAARPTIKLDLAADEVSGTVIGRYKLLQKIGEGGCGVVYMRHCWGVEPYEYLKDVLTRSNPFKLFEDFLRAAIAGSRSALVPRATRSRFEIHTVEQKLQGLGGESDLGRRLARALREVEATFLKPLGQHDHAALASVLEALR